MRLGDNEANIIDLLEYESHNLNIKTYNCKQN